jgi:hypothetical protein
MNIGKRQRRVVVTPAAEPEPVPEPEPAPAGWAGGGLTAGSDPDHGAVTAGHAAERDRVARAAADLR